MYKLVKIPGTWTLSDYAIRLEDGAFVHRETNQEYLKWLAEGNVPLPPDEQTGQNTPIQE